jgi:hypothetical protein
MIVFQDLINRMAQPARGLLRAGPNRLTLALI